MANIRVYRGNSPNRVERRKGFQPITAPRPETVRGSLQFKPLTVDGETPYPTTADGRITDVDDFARCLGELLSDPMRCAQLLVESRRPGNVSKVRHEISMRKAGREPMLNADPAQTRAALEGRTKLRRNARLDKLAPFKRIVVKPSSRATGARGWQERMWTIHQLKYGRGVVAVTDDGDETVIAPQWSELRSLIIRSGWDIIREEVPTGGNKRARR